MSKAHHVVFVWYALLNLILLFATMHKHEPVPPSLHFVATAIPLMAVPVSLFIALAGVIDSIRYRAWKFALIHVMAIVVMFGLLKYIAS